MLYQLARKISAQRLFEKRYKQPYQWFIEREHLNKPDEMIGLLKQYFFIKKQTFFPFYLPITHFNLCIGLVLCPR